MRYEDKLSAKHLKDYAVLIFRILCEFFEHQDVDCLFYEMDMQLRFLETIEDCENIDKFISGASVISFLNRVSRETRMQQ